MGQIFISYRREDSGWSTGRIYDRLVKYFPQEQIFIDVDSIAPGDDFVTYIEDAVKNCDVLLAVIGQKWIESIQANSQKKDFVRLEIASALKNNIRVIPILVENTKMPTSESLPEELKSLSYKNAYFINHIAFNSEIEKLIKNLKSFLLDKEKKLEEDRIKQVEEEKRIIQEQLKQTEIKKSTGMGYIAWFLIIVVYIFCTILVGGLIDTAVEIIVSLIWSSNTVADGSSVDMFIFFTSMIAAFILLLKPAAKILSND